MPRLQKVYEKFKDRPDVVVLTLNEDTNPGLAESFMRQNGLTLPILPAMTYSQETLGVLGVPDNWLIDVNGVVRLKQIYYVPSRKWQTWMSELIEKYRPGAASAPPSTTP